jgi:hypothetical protein
MSGGEIFASSYTTSTSATIIGLVDNTYTRRVYAIDKLGNTGTWSNIRSFTTDTIVPTVPELLYPNNAEIFYTSGRDFLWS